MCRLARVIVSCFFYLMVLSPCFAEPVLLKKEKNVLPNIIHPDAEVYPSWFKNSFLDLREDVAEAQQENKRVLLFFYQDGCPYCKKLLDVNLAQKSITDKMRQHLDVVAMNMWGDREITDISGETMTEKNFAVKMNVMFTPTLLFLNEKGRVILRVNGYYRPNKFAAALNYVVGHKESVSTFRAYYKKLDSPKSLGRLHKQSFISTEPNNLARVKQKNSKPMLVLFEQKHCPACDELHNDIFKRTETLKYLKKFDVVQLDMWSEKVSLTTPRGKKISANNWANELDIKYAPSMVFFNTKGNEVFRVEAYFKSFHLQSVLDYISSESYIKHTSFQRWLELRADKIRDKGVEINLMR